MLARVEDGVVLELRDIALEDVPEHKRSLWRILVDNIPVFSADTQSLVKAAPTITDVEVVLNYTVESRPIEEVKSGVKEEAFRRIVSLYSEKDQLNMLINMIQLMETWRVTGKWTLEEELAATALQQGFTQIVGLVNKSKEISEMKDIPLDYKSDRNWV